MKESCLYVGIDVDPSGGLEDIFHLVFVADDQEIDHVAGIAVFVANAARDFREESGIDAGHRLDLLDGDEVGIGRIDFNVDGVGAGAGIDAHLIEADGESAAGVGDDVALSADEKGLSEGGVSDTTDDGAAACSVVGKHANEILEIAGEAAGVSVGFVVGVMHFAGDGGDDVFAGLNGDAGVHPGLIAGNGDVLREAALAGRNGGGWGGGLGLLRPGAGGGRGWWRAVVPEELRVRDFGGDGAKAKARNPNNGGSHPISTHGCISLGKPLRTNVQLSVLADACSGRKRWPGLFLGGEFHYLEARFLDG